MTAIITNQFRLQNLQYSKRDIDSGVDSYYLAIGRAESWPNDSLPPQPDITYEAEIDARKSMQSLKRITDIVHCAPRHNWVAGDTYVAWDDGDPAIATRAYYVLNTSNFNVYVCLRAGAGPSTVEPVGIDDDAGDGIAGSVQPVERSDGYVWKYLYTISASDANRFLTADFLPVFRNQSVADTTVQGQIWDLDLQEAGVGYTTAPTLTIEGDGTGAAATATITGGVVTGIDITNNGSGYTFARVVVSGGSPTTAARMRPIVSPQALGREIAGIDVTVGGTSYPNGPLNLIVEGDGIGASVTANVTGGVIQNNPTISDAGYGYTSATVRPEDTTAGTDANFAIELTGPRGGFGYNPVADLNAYFLMFNILLDGPEGMGDFIPGNNYRQLMIIKNPLDRGTPQKLWTEDTGSALSRLIVDPGGTWVQDDIVTGGASSARAIIDFYDPNTETLFVHQTDVTGFGSFNDGESLTGASVSAGAISATTGSSNNASEVDPFSGRLMYLENRVPVSRAPDQTEDIKLVVQY